MYTKIYLYSYAYIHVHIYTYDLYMYSQMYIHVCVNIYLCIYILERRLFDRHFCTVFAAAYNIFVRPMLDASHVVWFVCHVDRKNPPRPRGGFLFTMFPHQEPWMREPPSKNLYQVLRGGSSYSRFLMREHRKQETPPGGGVSFDQSDEWGFFRSMCVTYILYADMSTRIQ